MTHQLVENQVKATMVEQIQQHRLHQILMVLLQDLLPIL